MILERFHLGKLYSVPLPTPSKSLMSSNEAQLPMVRETAIYELLSTFFTSQSLSTADLPGKLREHNHGNIN